MLFIEEAERWVNDNYPSFKFIDAHRQLENNTYFIYLTLVLPEESLYKLRVLSKGQSRLLAI